MAAKYLTEMQIRRLTDAVLFVILLSDLKNAITHITMQPL